MIPVSILSIKKLRTITGCVIASCGVLVGMWLERFLIVVPSLGHKYLPYSWGTYRPRPVEIIITISTFAAMTLLYVLFSKFVPIISIWEMKVGEQEPHETAQQRLQHAHRGAAAMSAVYALYSDPAAAQRAVNGLYAAGIPENDVVVMSGEPFEAQPFAQRDSATWLWYIACLGGFLGLAGSDLAHADDGARLAAADRQHADRRLVAEPDRDVRDDDAGSDPRDRADAVHHREAAEPGAAALRP